MKIRLTFIILATFIFVVGFVVPAYKFKVPDYFPELVYNFENNPSSEEKIMLGRALFYDPILSKDSTISCASCHSPFNAFAHTDHDLSHGIRDSIGTRNAPPLFNLAWQESFMWDGAINHLDMQALAPINHPSEMDETIKNVVNKIQKKALYPPLFAQAYGDSLVTGERVLKALSQFQLTLISANAKYDKVRRGEKEFTPQEQNGYELFKANCNTCHTEPLFTNSGFANNGLPIDTTLNDYGKWKITKQSKDSLLFKIPSLRNLSFTYPYMHDGRFRRLHQVIKHYTTGIHRSPTLADELKQPIQLTDNERVDLVAFLLTLDDKSFVFYPHNLYPREIFIPKRRISDK